MQSELTYAIQKLNSNKASGPDGVYAEMFKHGGPELEEKLLELMNRILSEGQTPDQFHHSKVSNIPKKGSALECKNSRPISLLSHGYKLLAQIIYNRISESLCTFLPPNQAAYQSGRGCIEQIQHVQQIIEKCNEFKVPCFICFVDYRKAFDTIRQDKLFEALLLYTDIDPIYIALLINLYDVSTAQISTDVGLTRVIKILRGTKQGDLLSALLFCFVLALILQLTFEDIDTGLSVGGIKHTDLEYADDAALFIPNEEHLHNVIEKLVLHSRTFGLELNFDKTKIMIVGNTSDSRSKLNIAGHDIDVVQEFEYLGRIISNNADDLKAVEGRINKGWQAFQNKKDLITSRQLSYKTKKDIYETFILPVVLYSMETVTWKPILLQKLVTFQNHIMRFMTNHLLSDRVPIAQLQQTTNLNSIDKTVKMRKLKWFGHMKRSSYPVKQVFEGLINGNRGRGRPQRRWRDDIKEWLQMDWNMINTACRDREHWFQLCTSVI